MYLPIKFILKSFAVVEFLIALLACGCGRHMPVSSPPAKPIAQLFPPGLFEDVTERVGITFHHTNGEPVQYLFLQTIGGGCAFLDYDNDGDQDILLLSCGNFPPSTSEPPNLALYRNNGVGTFTDKTTGSGLDKPLGYAQALAVGDYDNDGYPDVFVAGYGRCYLFHNQEAKQEGQGVGNVSKRKNAPSHFAPSVVRHFEDVTKKAGLEPGEGRWASGAAWGDYDNDGKLDLYVCYYAHWSPQRDRLCPRPDGGVGLCVPTVYDGEADRLYHNEGGGRFREVTKSAGIDRERRRGLAVTWLDYNGDGYIDIYVANDMDPNLLWRNNGDGTFSEVAGEAGVALGADGVATSGMGIAVGDYENKGRESLFVTNLNGEVYSLFRNEGNGLFSYASDRAGLFQPTLSTAGWGVAFFDFDRDGWLDIITGNSHVDPEVDRYVPGIHYQEPKGLYRNTQRGTFIDITARSGALALPRATRGLAVGDYDNDGRLDVLCINRNARADLFRNVSPDKNHWVTFRLVGVKSNRDGAGAKVWMTAGGMRRYVECRLGSSYASSSDKRLHFGLGTATRVERLEVLWPSRRRDVYRGVEGDRFYVVTEGKGYAPEK
jgi:hypothetical protein